MNVLIIYATIEGQTRKIGDHLKATLEGEGHRVSAIDATVSQDVPAADTFDAVIVAAPVHAGTFPSTLRRIIKGAAKTLMARPGAFISVSLSAISDDPSELDEIGDMVEAFSNETGWWPVSIHHAAGALKYTEYDFFRRWMLKRISAKEGGPTDTSRDYEFTAWPKLDAFAIEFVEQAPVLAGKI
ncbi:flavodoxin domain-containing protein [Oricola cellulosilytica]|nr:flavodoxin domain-containing protein [Oricola cellulosilytica]